MAHLHSTLANANNNPYQHLSSAHLWKWFWIKSLLYFSISPIITGFVIYYGIHFHRAYQNQNHQALCDIYQRASRVYKILSIISIILGVVFFVSVVSLFSPKGIYFLIDWL